MLRTGNISPNIRYVEPDISHQQSFDRINNCWSVIKFECLFTFTKTLTLSSILDLLGVSQHYSPPEYLTMATRRNLTYKEKVSVLEALDKGDRSRLEVAASFSIAMPTLLRILRTRESIVQLGLSEGERTRIRQPTYAEVHNRRLELFFPCIALTHNPFVPLQIEEQLLVWINEQNSEGTKVSGKMIKEKASEIAIQMEIFNFPASNGWLDNFRRRYGFSKTNELSAEMQSRMGDIILSYEPDHGSPILLPKKRKVESQPREGKSVAKCFYSLSLPPTHLSTF